jgi:zinc transport system substrate-binding protein
MKYPKIGKKENLMNNKQKILVLGTIVLISALLASAILAALSQEKKEGLTVVATFYPLAYFAEEIAGDKAEVICLVPYNNEIHTWQPSTSDILAVDEAEIVVYNGAHLDFWFEEDILPAINKDDKIIVETTRDIDLMESEDDHEHDSLDPHTWLSPFYAKQQAKSIYDALIQEDPGNTEYYNNRWNNLEERFEGLDENFTASLSSRNKDDIFVTHAAFGYLAERYGFEQHGVIGLSAEEQPSTSAIAGLVDMMADYEVYVVYVDPIYSDEYAQTLKNELEAQTGESVKILKLYFMLGPIDGMDYFDQQEANLENLMIGLEA